MPDKTNVPGDTQASGRLMGFQKGIHVGDRYLGASASRGLSRFTACISSPSLLALGLQPLRLHVLGMLGTGCIVLLEDTFSKGDDVRLLKVAILFWLGGVHHFLATRVPNRRLVLHRFMLHPGGYKPRHHPPISQMGSFLYNRGNDWGEIGVMGSIATRLNPAFCLEQGVVH